MTFGKPGSAGAANATVTAAAKAGDGCEPDGSCSEGDGAGNYQQPERQLSTMMEIGLPLSSPPESLSNEVVKKRARRESKSARPPQCL